LISKDTVRGVSIDSRAILVGFPQDKAGFLASRCERTLSRSAGWCLYTVSHSRNVRKAGERATMPAHKNGGDDMYAIAAPRVSQLLDPLDRVPCVLSPWVHAAGSVERMYVLYCGESTTKDVSANWSPGVNVGVARDFSSNCYLIKHASGWLLWDSGMSDTIAATPEGVTAASGCSRCM
jgi:hypothetical protein